MKPAIHRHVTVYESSKAVPRVGIIIEVPDHILTEGYIDGMWKAVPAMCVRVLSSICTSDDSNAWLPQEQGLRDSEGRYWEWPTRN